jgi:aspartate aminotransferase
LDRYCKNRKNPDTPLILLLNYPNNPSGQTFNLIELKALAETMQKHSVIVIADEIYSLLNYKGKQPSIAEYYPQGTIITSGLSKWCGAGGWRLGFAYIPPQLGKKFFKGVIGVASETYSCASSPIQIAATQAYQDKTLAKDFLSKQTQMLAQINDYCVTRLQQANVRVHPCMGGFYIFPDYSAFKQKLAKRNINTSNQLTAALMDEIGVALLPGSAFGMPEDSLTTRLAFVDFDGSQILDESLDQFKFDSVKNGIERLCDWLGKL